MSSLHRVWITLCLALFVISIVCGPPGGTTACGQEIDKARLEAEFFKLCDLACQEINKEGRRVAFYQDSYAVRALAVAYDMTNNKAYLDACQRWSDRMVDFQNQMTPQGAYYMNYGRKPGQPKGEWFVADCASIALAVLATGVRTSDPAKKDCYLKSVNSYAELVMKNYVGPAGGITDGLWSRFDGEWWCSSGIFASVAFMLYDRTGEDRYRKVGEGAVDWLNHLEIRKAQHISFEEAAPSVIMYVFEGYSTALPFLKPGTELHKGALAQIAFALDWMAKNQAGRGVKSKWDYQTQWGSKLGGLPFHMLIYACHLPDGEKVRTAADQEIRHLSTLLFKEPTPKFTQLTMFSMMSYAEKLRPGAIYRKEKAGR